MAAMIPDGGCFAIFIAYPPATDVEATWFENDELRRAKLTPDDLAAIRAAGWERRVLTYSPKGRRWHIFPGNPGFRPPPPTFDDSESLAKIDVSDPLTCAAIYALQAFEEYEADRRLYSICLLGKAADYARRALGVEDCDALKAKWSAQRGVSP